MVSAGDGGSVSRPSIFDQTSPRSILFKMEPWKNDQGSTTWIAVEFDQPDGTRLLCTAHASVPKRRELVVPYEQWERSSPAEREKIHDDFFAQVEAEQDYKLEKCSTYSPETPGRRTRLAAEQLDSQAFAKRLEFHIDQLARAQRLDGLDDQLEAAMKPFEHQFASGQLPPVENIMSTVFSVLGAIGLCQHMGELGPVTAAERVRSLFDPDQCPNSFLRIELGDIVMEGGWSAASGRVGSTLFSPILNLPGTNLSNDPRRMDIVVLAGSVTITFLDSPPLAELVNFQSSVHYCLEGMCSEPQQEAPPQPLPARDSDSGHWRD